MNYILLAVAVLLAVSNNAIYHKLGGAGQNSRFFFTAVSSVVWLAVLLCGGVTAIQPVELWFGVLYGAVQAMFLFFKMQAMSSGPISITSVVSNCSMLLTTVFGVLFFMESVGVLQVIGVCAIVVSVLLCTDPKADMQMTARWKLYCLGFFVFAASVGIIFKFFARTSGNGNNMMVVSAVTMVVLMMLLSFARGESKKLDKTQLVCALLAGAVSCGYNRLNLYLSGVLPTVVQFPIFNGAVVLFSTLSGVVLYKETFSKKQRIGILIGLIAIIFVSGVFQL